jgi:hypothetical protein
MPVDLPGVMYDLSYVNTAEPSRVLRKSLPFACRRLRTHAVV